MDQVNEALFVDLKCLTLNRIIGHDVHHQEAIIYLVHLEFLFCIAGPNSHFFPLLWKLLLKLWSHLWVLYFWRLQETTIQNLWRGEGEDGDAGEKCLCTGRIGVLLSNIRDLQTFPSPRHGKDKTLIWF